jgi:hypothetical protein
MFENNHNGQNLAKIKAQVVSWRLTKHIREIPIISDWLYDLNVSQIDQSDRLPVNLNVSDLWGLIERDYRP